jgi:hypothetical protein
MIMFIKMLIKQAETLSPHTTHAFFKGGVGPALGNLSKKVAIVSEKGTISELTNASNALKEMGISVFAPPSLLQGLSHEKVVFSAQAQAMQLQEISKAGVKTVLTMSGCFQPAPTKPNPEFDTGYYTRVFGPHPWRTSWGTVHGTSFPALTDMCGKGKIEKCLPELVKAMRKCSGVIYAMQQVAGAASSEPALRRLIAVKITTSSSYWHGGEDDLLIVDPFAYEPLKSQSLSFVETQALLGAVTTVSGKGLKELVISRWNRLGGGTQQALIDACNAQGVTLFACPHEHPMIGNGKLGIVIPTKAGIWLGTHWNQDITTVRAPAATPVETSASIGPAVKELTSL